MALTTLVGRLARRPDPDVSRMSDDRLRTALVQRAFELNLTVCALSLRGAHVDLDVVDRVTPAQPRGFPEIVVGVRGA